MIAFIVHDHVGNLKGVVVPGGSVPGRRRGVRSHNGHDVSVVDLPEIEHSELHAHVTHLMATHRLEKATAIAPARLVAKPKEPKKKG